MTNPYQSSRLDSGFDSPFEVSAECRGMINVTRIITLAMAMGVVLFLVFAMVSRKAALNGEAGPLSWFAMAFAVVAVALSLFLPKNAIRTAFAQFDVDAYQKLDADGRFRKMFPLFQTGHIIGIALLEAAGFFNVVAYYVFSPFVGNLIAVAALIALIVSRFPTDNAVGGWMQQREREVLSRVV